MPHWWRHQWGKWSQDVFRAQMWNMQYQFWREGFAQRRVCDVCGAWQMREVTDNMATGPIIRLIDGQPFKSKEDKP